MGDLSWWPWGSAGAGAAAGAAAAPGAPAPGYGCREGVAMMTGAEADICRLIRTFSSPSVISISPIPDSWTRSISFFSFLRSMSGAAPEVAAGRFQGELVDHGPQARDHAGGDVGEIGVFPEGFPGVDVRQVHLDEGDADRREGVAKRDTGVRESRRIDDDVGGFVAFRGMDALDEGGFRVALQRRKLVPGPLGLGRQPGIDRFEGIPAVVLGFALPQQVQVRPVNHQDLRHDR